jgi:NADH:quinone reductase (non-electrogenic)
VPGTTVKPRVVVIGGGFAGLFAARAMRRADVEVTLLDRAGHHLFQPLLYQCATGILSEGQIAAPLRELLKKHHNVEFLVAEVEDIDARRQVVGAVRPGGARIELPYDHLVVAAGVRQSYFGHDEYAQWAPGMKTIADALTIRRKVFGAFELAESATDDEERRRWLTFALVGGGPTGVELAGQIRELATKTLRAEYRKIRPEDARVLLFDGGTQPLAAFGPNLAGRAAKRLEELGVELMMESRVTSVDAGGLVVSSGDGALTRFEAGTVLWTAGVAAPPFAHALAAATGAETDRAGRIKVEPDLTVPGHPEIAVVGDVMNCTDLPGLAEVAMQSGAYAGRRIRHLVAGKEHQKPFHYIDLGSAAYISRGRAIISAGPIKLSGRLGWLSWLFIHIAFLTGYRNRFTAVLTWFVAFSRDMRRERAFTTQGIHSDRDVYARSGPPAPVVLPRAPAEASPAGVHPTGGAGPQPET